MAPVAIESVSELVTNGQKHIVAKSAPSISANGHLGGLRELRASNLILTRNTEPKAVPEPDSPEVWAQNVCTDHMITCKWTSTAGWSSPNLGPYGPFSIMPTASVLHYATECFEGLKLYRGYDGRLRLFRPNCNARRMLHSATRIALPAFDPIELEKLIEALCAVDGAKWLPASRPGSFLYLRPTMIATADNLGVQKPKEALLYIIACCFPCLDRPPPMGDQIKVKSPGMKLLASREDTVRAWPGGFGFAKVGANYGPSLIAQAEAKERGFDQVLWLLGQDNHVTEAGASNFFVVWRSRQEGVLQLVTAPLGSKIILDGVTRRSVLQLARERLTLHYSSSSTRDGGHIDDDDNVELERLEVVERTFTMAEIEEAAEEGRLVEAFACGTAVFICPVSEIHFRGKDFHVPMNGAGGTTGRYAAVVKRWLEDIMYGQEKHEWGVVIDEGQIDEE